MYYKNVNSGKFQSRPNRFIAYIEIDGKTKVCHVKNTGRCKELLIPETDVFLEKSDNPNRKTEYDLIATKKGDFFVNIDSQAPNKVFEEFARSYEPETMEVCREVSFGKSRIDFCLKTINGYHYVEVKGVTLEKDGHAKFPDAPTERGIKHIQELERAIEEGHRATIFFVIQMENIQDFSPNDETHPQFGEALRHAVQRGVNVVAYTCKVGPDYLEIDKPVKVVL